MRSRIAASARAAGWLLGPLLLYLLLAMAAYWPASLHPGRFMPANRTAAKHATTMYYFGDYFRGGSRPLAWLDIWNYPEGGIAKPQAVPSLALGWVLTRVAPPRLVFNLLVLFNLVLSGLSFFLLARRIGLDSAPATAAGVLAVFHPVLQSFLLRGQIENTTLWPAGFALLALASLLPGEGSYLPAFLAACLLPLVTLGSTAYYALFLLPASVVLLGFLMARLRLGWRQPGVRRYAAALALGALLMALGARFYRPNDSPSGPINLHPNTLQLGLAGVTPAAALADLVRPGEFLHREKPYLGLSFLFFFLPATTFLLARRRMVGEAGVLLGGTLLFGLLALGRSVGMPGGPVSNFLPATLVDRLIPDFRLFTMLVRALPFMALCGGLAVALALQELPPRLARAALALLVLLTLGDHLAVRAPNRTDHLPVWFDARTDLDPAILALPKARRAELPLADLPPPLGEHRNLWGAYTYLQAEHLQKVVWSDAIPDPPRGATALLVDVYDRPEEYARDSARLSQWARAMRHSGIRLVVLHKDFVSQERAILLSSVLDSVFPRTGESTRVTIWDTVGEAEVKTEGM